MIQDFKETTREVVQAVLPLTLAVLLIMFAIGLNSDLIMSFIMGAVLVILGMVFFLMGVKLGMLPIGEAIGSELPKHNSIIFIVVVAFILSFMATVAEPDVRVLALQVDMVSGGAISSTTLILTVAAGVGISVGFAMLRIILKISINYLIIAGYAMVFILASFTPSHFVPVSFDAGGVTTGPMTVPFILALGVGVSSVLAGRSSSSEGFGLVALASIGPILAVLLLGVMYF